MRYIATMAVGLFLLTGMRPASAAEPFVMMLNWFAQAEHGGFYQASADGTYKAAGLDVTVRQGGAQVNPMQLLAAGQVDCIVGSSDVNVLQANQQGVPAVSVAAVFQTDPQVLVAHSDVTRMEDLYSRTIILSPGSHNNWFKFLTAKFPGFADAQTRPFTGSYQPFVVDNNVATQGYTTDTPYNLQTHGGDKAKYFVIADYGWPVYASLIVCLDKTIEKRPNVVAAFVKASLQGYKRYLTGDPSLADAAIKQANPTMKDGNLASARATMKNLVMGGDAATMGLGAMTDERMKRTFELLSGLNVIDAKKIDLKKTYTTRFITEAKVTP